MSKEIKINLADSHISPDPVICDKVRQHVADSILSSFIGYIITMLEGDEKNHGFIYCEENQPPNWANANDIVNDAFQNALSNLVPAEYEFWSMYVPIHEKSEIPEDFISRQQFYTQIRYAGSVTAVQNIQPKLDNNGNIVTAIGIWNGEKYATVVNDGEWNIRVVNWIWPREMVKGLKVTK